MRDQRGRSWGLVLLVVLVAVNLVLIAMLLRPGLLPWGVSAPDGEPAPAPSTEPSTTADVLEGPTTSAAPTETPTTAAPEDSPDRGSAEGPDRILVNADAKTGWRAAPGDCSTPGAMEYTSDAGATWAPQDPGLGPLTRLKVLGSGAIFGIGGGEGCAATYRSSASAGAEWESADEFLAGSWYLVPDDAARVNTPAGGQDVVCADGVADLAGLDDLSAAMLCADGRLHITADGGTTWDEADVTARALGVSENGFVLAGTSDDCPGTSIQLTDAAGASDGSGCAPASAEAALAVSGGGGAVWLWAGDELLVSTDDGVTW